MMRTVLLSTLMPYISASRSERFQTNHRVLHKKCVPTAIPHLYFLYFSSNPQTTENDIIPTMTMAIIVFLVIGVILVIKHPGARRALASAPSRFFGSVFVAIDFETANNSKDSACALGIVVFQAGKPVDRKYYLINPRCKFSAKNISIHGIQPSDVERAPTFDKLWPHIRHYFRYSLAGYWTFDLDVLKALSARYRISMDLSYIDVCAEARDKISYLENYKLPTGANFLGITGLQHHNALSDAETCGLVHVALSRIKTPLIPATDAQKDYIQSLGGSVSLGLTKAHASELIDALVAKRDADRQAAYEAERAAKQRSKEAPDCLGRDCPNLV